MTRLFILCAVIATLPLSASELRLHATSRPANAPATVSEVFGRMRDRAAAKDVRSSVVMFETSDSSFLIPVAGNVAGLFGTHFRSDLAISNLRDATQRVALVWLAAGRDNTNDPVPYFNLPAKTVIFDRDVVGRVLGKSGLGSILVVGVDSAGNIDDFANLDGTSRIWTAQSGSTGTVSQGFDSVSVAAIAGTAPANLAGLRQDASFRTNVGVVNLEDRAHTFTVRSVATGATTTIPLPPFSMNQVSLAAGSATSTGDVALTITTSSEGLWTAYAGSTDNITGDGWAVRAKQ